ncbi:MAG TPA: glycosyltransferase family 2 protein [Candidatus Dormibacteraeota bacterium]|nr:glycosyltransferase family 2 protein [Candidatus Dormibacteraeota bacterium]
MTSPLVSVIIPARNAENTVGNAIASVLEQSMPDLELIVVDDASTDRTAPVVAAMRDARIRLLRSERNIRCAAARNLGLRNARGKWAAFLDADDEWAPGRLESLLSIIQDCENGYAVDFQVLAVPGPLGRLVRANAPRPAEDGRVEDVDFDAILQLGHDVSPIVSVPACARAGIRFPESGSGGEWVFFLSKLFAQGMQGRLVRRPGYLCRAQAAHDSSTLRAREEYLNVLEILAADESLPETSRRLLSKRMAYVREGLVAAALRRRDGGTFVRYARRYPRAVLRLPRRAVLFIAARARLFLAASAVSRNTNPALPR